MYAKFCDVLLAKLMDAYFVVRRGKGLKLDEHQFELDAFNYLCELRDEILSRRYEPRPAYVFVQKKPVVREVFASEFRDKIVQQMMFSEAKDFWMRHMIYDSFACVQGRGTWFGIKRAEKQMREITSNFSREAWVFKMDIEGYFVTLDRKKVLERIEWGLFRQYPKGGEMFRTMKYLWRKTLLFDPCRNARKIGDYREFELIPKSKSLFYQKSGCGLIAGNVTSQLAANVYLDLLDRYIRFELKRKYYGRYCDDFYFFVRDEDFIKGKEDVRRIDRFLKNELGLKLHPNKKYIQKVEKGMPFLGVIIYPRRIVPGRRVIKNFRQAVKDVEREYRNEDVISSYVAFMKNLNGRNISKKILKDKFEEYFE